MVAETLNSEAQGVVTVAAPDNHRNRKGEGGSQSGPAEGDQHGSGTAEDLRRNTSGCYLGWETNPLGLAMVCNPSLCCGAPHPVTSAVQRCIRPQTSRLGIAVSVLSAQTPIKATNASPTAVQERQRVRQPYPNYRVIVLDDNVNTFQHVVECLVRHLPGMQPDLAWELAHRIDGEGSAVVWRGPQEQAELYHQLLGAEGLTMAPLERD